MRKITPEAPWVHDRTPSPQYAFSWGKALRGGLQYPYTQLPFTRGAYGYLCLWHCSPSDTPCFARTPDQRAHRLGIPEALTRLPISRMR